MDALAAEIEVDRLEARIAAETAAALRAAWAGAPLRDAPALVEPAVRAALDRARGAGGAVGARAAALWRMALGAAFGAGDAARATPPAARTEAGLARAIAWRQRRAVELGARDAWALARAAAGEVDAPEVGAVADVADGDAGADLDPAVVAAAAAAEPACARALATPAPLLDRLAAARGVDPAPIVVDVGDGDAAAPGRTFVIVPGRDVRVRVRRRPGVTARAAVRVLLHELGHALTGAAAGAAPWALAMPAARADDEGLAAHAAARLEDPAWVADALAVPAEVAAAVAAVERAARRRRRAGLDAAARAERAAYRDGGPPPWRDALAWTDPGASASYAAAEAVRDRLDGRGG